MRLTSLPKALRGSFLFLTFVLGTEVQLLSKPDLFFEPGGGEEGREPSGVGGMVPG